MPKIYGFLLTLLLTESGDGELGVAILPFLLQVDWSWSRRQLELFV